MMDVQIKKKTAQYREMLGCFLFNGLRGTYAIGLSFVSGH